MNSCSGYVFLGLVRIAVLGCVVAALDLEKELAPWREHSQH